MTDLISTWLSDLRIRHTFLVVGKLGGHVAVRIDPEEAAAFHYCQHGSCVVEAAGQPPIELGAGDFLFMREGLARVVRPTDPRGARGGRRGRPQSLRSLLAVVERDSAVEFSLGSADHVVLGGGFCIESPEARWFIAALPAMFCVRRGAPYMPRLAAIVDELVAEAATPGANPIIARLAEVAVLIAIRSFATTTEPSAPLLDAARDPRLGRALAAIQREPSRAWTIAQLGRVAGMSRSGFAAEFTERVGEAPVAYVAKVRMARAERLLVEQSDLPLPKIAEEVGYASAAAFSVAFKRIRGVSPSDLRRQTIELRASRQPLQAL